MQIREFYPTNSEPQAVLILPNHLGSTFESDFSGRAELLAESLGMLVLAYERPGSGDESIGHIETEPSRYVRLAAQTGRDLENRLNVQIGAKNIPRILTGNSAAASDAIMVARSQTLQADYLIAADPVGISAMTKLEFRRHWLRHQRLESRLKSSPHLEEAADVQDANSGVKGKARLGIRFLRDLDLYGDIWRSSIVHDALNDIAEFEGFSELAVNVAFVEHSFSGTPEFMFNLANELNGRQRRSETAAKFIATYLPDTYHSHFNSAQNFADFVRKALVDIVPSPNTAA